MSDTRSTLPRSRTAPAERAFRALEAESAGYVRGFHRDFVLGGHPVRLTAETAKLAEILHAPFSHLPTAMRQTSAALTIRVHTGLAPPYRPDEGPTFGGGLDHAVGSHRIQASPGGRFVCHTVLASGSLWCLDRERGRIESWVREPSELTAYEKGKPFQRLLELWLDSMGLSVIHAGLVGWRGAGILFGGPGGVGKSTTSLCCLRDGMEFLGEDFAVLEEGSDGTFFGHSLYCSAWLEPPQLAHFGELSGHAIRGSGIVRGKSMVILRGVFPERLRSSIPLRLLLLPRLTPGTETTLTPAGRAEAMKRFAPSCLFTASRLRNDGFERLVRLLRGLSCYWLNLGSDLNAVAARVKAVAERHHAAGPGHPGS